MNANARKWVAALRSGEYLQGTDALNMGGRYCCLGVACELYKQENELPIGVINDMTYYGGQDEFLPECVREWLGLRYCDGSYGRNRSCSLATDNDSGKAFDEIAFIIEDKAHELFIDEPTQIELTNDA